MVQKILKMLKKVFNKTFAPEIVGVLILIITFSNLSFNNYYLNGQVTNTISTIKYGVSSYQAKQNEDISIQIEIPQGNYIAVIINLMGTNDYIKTLYYYCHQDYQSNACSKIETTKLTGPTTINLNLETNNLMPGNYNIVITTINEFNQKEKVSTPNINIAREGYIDRELNCSNYFADMSTSHPLCTEVTYLREKGIFMGQEIKGKRVANLNTYLVRSEFFAVAARLYDKKYSYSIHNPENLLWYKDISPKMIADPNNKWWINAILNLEGILTGYSDQTIRPNQTLTMAELAKITALATNYVSYFDENKEPWYRDILNAYRAENIYFDPRVSVKRSDAVRLIYDTLMLTGEGIE